MLSIRELGEEEAEEANCGVVVTGQPETPPAAGYLRRAMGLFCQGYGIFFKKNVSKHTSFVSS